jgi:hypothetical protein
MLTRSERVEWKPVFLFCVLTATSSAQAYTQDKELENKLQRNDSNALALLPADGFKNGAAGVFRTHALYVVPDSQRAWCTDHPHGVLKPGCYIEFFVQGEGLQARDQHRRACGHLGRWYRAPGAKYYVPTPGPFMSHAIANGDSDQIEAAVYGEPDARRLPARSCGPYDRTRSNALQHAGAISD